MRGHDRSRRIVGVVSRPWTVQTRHGTSTDHHWPGPGRPRRPSNPVRAPPGGVLLQPGPDLCASVLRMHARPGALGKRRSCGEWDDRGLLRWGRRRRRWSSRSSWSGGSRAGRRKRIRRLQRQELARGQRCRDVRRVSGVLRAGGPQPPSRQLRDDRGRARLHRLRGRGSWPPECTPLESHSRLRARRAGRRKPQQDQAERDPRRRRGPLGRWERKPRGPKQRLRGGWCRPLGWGYGQRCHRQSCHAGQRVLRGPTFWRE